MRSINFSKFQKFFAVGIFMFEYIFIFQMPSKVCFHINIKYMSTIPEEQIKCIWNNFPWICLNGLRYCGAKLWNDIFLSFTGDVNFIHVLKACFKDISLTELPTIQLNHVYRLYDLHVQFKLCVHDFLMSWQLHNTLKHIIFLNYTISKQENLSTKLIDISVYTLKLILDTHYLRLDMKFQ